MWLKWAWWLYMALLVAMGYGRMLEKDSGGFWSQYGPPLGATIVCIGIVAWLRNRALLSVWVWRFVLLCVGLLQLTGIGFAVYLVADALYAPATKLLTISALLAPAWFALYRYSYCSSNVWKATHR